MHGFLRVRSQSRQGAQRVPEHQISPHPCRRGPTHNTEKPQGIAGLACPLRWRQVVDRLDRRCRVQPAMTPQQEAAQANKAQTNRRKYQRIELLILFDERNDRKRNTYSNESNWVHVAGVVDYFARSW